jgi:hypothetical protein
MLPCPPCPSTNISSHYQYLDKFSGNKSRHHLSFGLMRIFRHDFTMLAGLVLLKIPPIFSGMLSHFYKC